MQGFCQRLDRGAGVRRAGRAVVGWLALALAVTVTQAIGVSPALAQHKPGSTAVSEFLLAWGKNDNGQLGNGSTTGSNVPIAVSLPLGTTVTAVAAGRFHSLALTSAGTVLAWGTNHFGQLGDGTLIDRSAPVEVSLPPGTTVTAVAAGGVHSMALTSVGTVLAWGGNGVGQLGDGSTTRRTTPVEAILPSGVTVTAVAAAESHSLAVTSAGAALAWGLNGTGQLGDGSTINRSTPVSVALPLGTEVTAIAAGRLHSLAVTSVGAALAWGYNGTGQLGDGTTINRSTPVSVALPLGAEVTAVVAGRLHSAALTTAGTALAWGDNGFGQLGNGGGSNSSEAVEVSLPTGTTLAAIASRDSDHTIAIAGDGTALAWGSNIFGQLGDGTTTNPSTPVPVALPTGITLLTTAAGSDHTLALPAQQSRSTTSVQVSPQDPTVDQDVTLTATVTCDLGSPTGIVTFRNNNTDLATVPLDTTNTATHTTTLPVGTNTLTADFTSTNTVCPNSQSEATTITVADPTDPTDPTDPDLPITGVSLPSLLGTATLLILIGASFIVLTRRHRSTHTEVAG
ncbi:Ig-like domain repeat protein [Salinispora tropica]|uniref:Regulator of chromosome condensation, RCC1 n=1 Tax=Salinispora tropica (strain ATCC BAA-916 / DSM 44818 / JCM 13857 / NBRC 105044 / CNB-440) TaxID=369723 RepID=A4X446_SALTO|nr:Ig-like domain repeat protein [Salinispora tropica]ABP53646.1 regulator of chromosome condensation, RCC1 [Salinispora tropica CNB-440]